MNHVPQVWETYEAAFSYTRFVSKRNARPVNNLGPAQYVLIDLGSGTISPLVDAPLGWGAGYFWDITKAVWSPDEREVAVSNTFLPLDSAVTKQGSYVRRPCVAVVEIASRRGECIKETPPLDGTKLPHPPHLLDFEWCAKGRGLLLRYDNGGDAGSTLITEFDRDRQGWRSVDDPVRKEMRSGTPLNRQLLIARRADINVPPVLTATDSQTGRSKVLWNPNPQLSNFDLGEATVYHWRDRAGHEWTGGLVKPPQYVSGRRYPLVIQTHGFDPNKFLKDGFYPTANAARALASRGIVVLQVAEIRAAAMFTPLEAEVNGRSGYESAIEHLAAEGLIDPLKVGIIGFSQTGWYVLDSLIRLPNSFLAATLAETFNVTLGEYLIGADYGSASEETAGAMGAQPFGNGIQRWLSQSPGFNTEKIRTPILFEENNPVTLIYCWDIYAALRLQSKPVELLYMRNGSHVLNRPLQLVASQEINVDWYDFWLNGHEDPDPGKSDQYARWRELRQLQKSE